LTHLSTILVAWFYPLHCLTPPCSQRLYPPQFSFPPPFRATFILFNAVPTRSVSLFFSTLIPVSFLAPTFSLLDQSGRVSGFVFPPLLSKLLATSDLSLSNRHPLRGDISLSISSLRCTIKLTHFRGCVREVRFIFISRPHLRVRLPQTLAVAERVQFSFQAFLLS